MPRRYLPAARPTIVAPEHEWARWWREHVVALDRAELAKLTGWSADSIKDMERGTTREGKPIDPHARRRYRLACAAVHAERAQWFWTMVGTPPA